MADDMRAEFDAWIQKNAAEMYCLTDVDLAWEAWQESAKRFETAAGWSMQHGTCHLYRTANGFRDHILQHQQCPQNSLHVCWVDRVVLHD